MPCYTEWDAYLHEGSSEYKTAKEKLEAKLKAVKHIIDYYYGVFRVTVSAAKHSGHQTFIEVAHHAFVPDENRIPMPLR